MHRFLRMFLAAGIAALAAAPVAAAATRMPVGFQDDPTFRWSAETTAALDGVKAANASIIRTTADWRAIAPERPANAANPFDKAYRLGDLDDLVRKAQERGIQVLITIWGTPPWANGGKTPNVPPTRLADLTDFARAISDRYSGRHPGYPYVGRYSIWNEPNLQIFLAPQFDAKGAIVSPRTYAALYRAGYAGIKARNATAKVAIGETSNQGRDHPATTGVSDSVAPATFARLLAQQKGLVFDAYATHPYATRPNLPPTQKVRWPNVTMTQLTRFETSLDQWFGRPSIPVWITEYGYETKPGEPLGVTTVQQAAYLSAVLRQLRADPRVQMFIWFIFRDSQGSLWQSGLHNASGAPKPASGTFAALAKLTAGDTQAIKPGVAPTIRLSLPQIAWAKGAGTRVGLTYRVYDGARLIAVSQPNTLLRSDDTVDFVASFKPAAGKTYTIAMDADNLIGGRISTTYNLVTSGTAAAAHRKA